MDQCYGYGYIKQKGHGYGSMLDFRGNNAIYGSFIAASEAWDGLLTQPGSRDEHLQAIPKSSSRDIRNGQPVKQPAWLWTIPKNASYILDICIFTYSWAL